LKHSQIASMKSVEYSSNLITFHWFRTCRCITDYAVSTELPVNTKIHVPADDATDVNSGRINFSFISCFSYSVEAWTEIRPSEYS